MKTKKRKIIISLVLISVIAILFMVTRSYVLNQVKEGLSQKLEALKSRGLNVQYDSIDIQWLKNIIVIDQLVINKTLADTGCAHPERISIEQIKIKGLKLWSLLVNKEFKVGEVTIANPQITLQEHSNFLRDTTSKKDAQFKLTINRLSLTAAHIEITDSGSCQLKTEYNSTITTSGITLLIQPGKPFDLGINTILCDSTSIKYPKTLYTLQIKRVKMDVPKGTVDLDTMKIIPQASKLEFARKLGHSKDRIEAVIPFIKLTGMRYQYQDTFAIEAAHTDIQFYITVFRDRRLPSKNKYKPLPIEMLRKLPFGLNIDTLEVTKSYVSYEEFAPETDVSGSVFFDNIKASIVNINNDTHLQGQTRMKAQSAFMGQGNLKIEAIFPWSSNQNCSLEGSLKDFNFSKINGMLKPTTKMEVKSGKLHSLTFKMAYNETRSDGELVLNYNDLTLLSFKEDNKEEKQGKEEKEEKKGKLGGLFKLRKHKKEEENKDQKKNNLKTFIINAFVIPTNMDESVPVAERTGKIMFYRDPYRPVFNYWWKSILSGLKSAVHLENMKLNKGTKKSDE